MRSRKRHHRQPLSRSSGPRSRRLKVAAGLLWRQGRVLLLQRHERATLFPLKWEFPGGKLRRGETPRQALARELREELRIRPRIGKLAAHYDYYYPNGLRVELWFYHVRSYRGQLASQRTAQARWVRVEELPDYNLLEGDLALLRRLRFGPAARRCSPNSPLTPRGL